MSYSSLISGVVPAHSSNYTQGRKGYKICKITPHHMAGRLTGEQCGRIFQNANRNASSNYGIGYDGRIYGYVDEENRAWTSSNSTNDCQAITVEVANSSNGGDWPISDAAWESLINLCVDVCKRYGFRLDYTGDRNGSLTRHNMFANTNCPGPYLQAKLPELARIVNEKLDGGTPTPTPVPEPTTDHQIGEVVTINGVYTASNSTKKLNPARNTGTITKIITGARNPYLLDNGNLGWVNDDCITSSTPAPQPTPTPAPSEGYLVKVTANALNIRKGPGTNYGIAGCIRDKGVYTIVETQGNWGRLKSGAGWICLDYTSKEGSAPSKKSNEEIANEVIAGKWGNGSDRKNRLTAAGYDYNAIQKIVNQKLK